MTWIEAVDYASRHPNPSGLYSAGIRVVLRYAGSEAWTAMTAAEQHELFAAKLGIRAMFEDAADQALKGRAQGVADAKRARAAWTALGYPTSYPIAFAIDFDASPAQLSGAVAAYVAGINSVEGQRDVEYGGIRTIDFLTSHKLAGGGFQTYAWSGGKWSAHATIEQYANGVRIAGATVDRCRISSTEHIWYPPTPKPPAGHAPGSRTLKPTTPPMTGSDVKYAQGKVGATADGIYGPHSVAAVKTWQSRHHLAVDGLVGPATWASMGVHTS